MEQGSLKRADSKATAQKLSNKEAKMANEQTKSNEYMAQALVEVVRVVVQTFTVACTAGSENKRPRMSVLSMKKPAFNGNYKDKYAEMRNFKLKVNNMFQNCNASQTERVAVIKNWLGRQDLQQAE